MNNKLTNTYIYLRKNLAVPAEVSEVLAVLLRIGVGAMNDLVAAMALGLAGANQLEEALESESNSLVLAKK